MKRLFVSLVAVSTVLLAAVATAVTPATAAEVTLRTLAAARNLRVGAAVNDRGLDSDNGYRDKLRYEFNSVTPETAMKWVNLEPEPGVYTWGKADAVVSFAQQNNQMVRGHTLVWHSALPTWVSDGSLSDQELRAALQRHVETTVKRYAGRVAVWDVVNEVLAEDGTLKQTIWLKRLGPGYIADAFRWARAADPSAKLYINDYNAEWSNPKRTALYNLVRDLRAQGVPIDGVGFQTHSLIKDPTPETIPPTQLRSTLELFAGLGVDVAVTELDVRLKLPVDERKLAAQAEIYRRVTAACVAVARCVSLTVWSLTDRYSWVPAVVPGWGAAHPLDAALARKPAYDQMQAVLADRNFTSTAVASHSGKCLAAPSGGAQFVQAVCGSGADQRLLFRRAAPKIYQIVDSSGTLCLTTGSGSALVRRTCALDSTDQRFELRPSGQGHQLVSVRTYKCVGVADGSTAAGAVVEQVSCSAGPTWRLADLPGHP
ncbi:endo-1,4-beta-xylanase [Nonomuraea rhodomycinica]|uniref:Beta-xylanase n=1 Tax=Nonomuraea rhodomycinica TaxID=1712872 RepID=A0A7Y6MGD7_9ACTN|nr:endo-1,4-beta-xylanase [Nonomuraea rhodomycinica]NUW46862.1 endo-1,4-beta-xylanase [Nonomuraea rhodomycinica]